MHPRACKALQTISRPCPCRKAHRPKCPSVHSERFTCWAVAAGVEGAVIIGKLLERTEADGAGATLGYNAATGDYEDMVKAGIIDPLKASAARCHNTALADDLLWAVLSVLCMA